MANRRILLIIATILGLTRTGHSLSLEALAEIESISENIDMVRGRIVRYFGYCLIFLFVGFIFNIAGFKEINYFFSIVFTIAACIIWSRGNYVTTVAGVGSAIDILRNGSNPIVGIEKSLKTYVSALGFALLSGSIVFYFLATIPFQDQPGKLLAIIATIILLALASERWGFNSKWWQSVIYGFTMIMLILNFASLVPRQIWIRYTNHDLYPAFHDTKTEQALARAESNESAYQDKLNAQLLNIIADKLGRGEKLTAEEELFYKQLKEERSNNSLPGRIGKLSFHSSSSSSSRPCPRPISSDGWIINSNGELVPDIRPGQTATKTFMLRSYPSTPVIYIPEDNYRFRFTSFQALIVEDNGSKKMVGKNEHYSMGITNGPRRIAFHSVDNMDTDVVVQITRL
jgi:hypothetical protein